MQLHELCVWDACHLVGISFILMEALMTSSEHSGGTCGAIGTQPSQESADVFNRSAFSWCENDVQGLRSLHPTLIRGDHITRTRRLTQKSA